MKRYLWLLAVLLLLGCQASLPPTRPTPDRPPQAPQPPPISADTPESPGPSVTVWAVDLRGKEPPSVLFNRHDEITLRGLSPDGRYLLFVKQLGLGKGDLRALPFLLDRTTGQVTEGQEMAINLDAVAWSGNGFWVNWLVELDLQMGVNTHDTLRKAIGADQERSLVAAVVSADGATMAALVAGANGKMDLIVGSTQGWNLTRIKDAVQGWQTQGDALALLLMSPDAKLLAIIGDSPRGALVKIADPAPTAWVPFGRKEWPMDQPTWSPDSAHLFVPGTGVINRDGTLALATSERGIWNRDGSGLILPGNPYQQTALDGSISPL